MSFIKKNLLFCILVFICLGAFFAGAFFVYSESGKVKEAQRSLTTAETKLKSILNSAPAPSEENLAAAQQNLEDLERALAGNRENLQRGASISTSDDGVSLIASIQQYITKFQKAVAAQTDEDGDLDPIKTPNNFAFGFKQYIDDTPIPDDATKISLLDKQRQILSYLLTELIMAKPESIDVVEREIVEINNENAKGFTVDPAISARVPGAIDTVAFRLTFTGYTDSLRIFLNSLARFELPIVVRSIKVKRPSGSETVVVPERGRGRGSDNIFDLFERVGNPSTSKPSEPSADGPKPVIEENISQFTVILEFIEVVLPDAQTQDIS